MLVYPGLGRRDGRLPTSLLLAPSPLGELAYLLNVPSSHLPPPSLFVPLAFLHHAIVPPIPTATSLCCISYRSGLVVDQFVSARSIIFCLIHLIVCLAVLPSGSVHVHLTFYSGSVASALVCFYSVFLFFFVFPFFPLSFFLFPFFFFFACNNAWSPLFNLPIYILMICGVFALGPNL
jgi:hypothetical protein